MMPTFPEGRDRDRALGIWAGAAGSGGALGVLLGGLLTDGPGWPWVFLINVPIGLAGALLARRLLSEVRERTARRLDVTGAIAVTAGASLLVFAFIQTEHVGWASVQTIVSLAAALGLLGAFVVIEGRSAEPLLPFTLFRSRSLSVANGGMILFAAGIYPLMFFLSLYLQQVLGYSPLEAGLAYIPLAMDSSLDRSVAAC
jgi:MFS family permease